MRPFLAAALGLPSRSKDADGAEWLQPGEMQLRAFAAVEKLFALLAETGL